MSKNDEYLLIAMLFFIAFSLLVDGLYIILDLGFVAVKLLAPSWVYILASLVNIIAFILTILFAVSRLKEVLS